MKKQLRIPRSGELSLAVKYRSFDPAEIPPFAAIRCSYQFSGDVQPSPKRFVCLTHQEQAAICIKVTSQIEAYKNNPTRMAGVVFYPAGSVQFFEKDTIVQPDNQVALLHSKLATQKLIKELVILGTMPKDFKRRLLEAALASETMTPKARKAFIGILMKHDS